ncbi:hypothetical protein BRC86_11395 [Halobacteriales archaeon QS_3_64_16]|nr:MAG: hypothetical protein BRC86_11395 [Halobacteriales archaeon QS_3_64_16]
MTRGGAIHVRNVLEGLRERGHDVRLLDWNRSPERPYQHSIAPRSRFVDGPLRTFRRAVAIGRRESLDVLVSKTRKTYLPGLAAARVLGVPHVVHVGSTLGAVGGGLGARIDAHSVETRLRAPHDAYLVVCELIADQLRARGVGGRIFTVGNAVDSDRFRPDIDSGGFEDRVAGFEEDELCLGYIGGLHGYKGVFDLAAAIERCGAPVGLLVAGDGPARARLEARLGDRAHFLGSVAYERMPAVYAAMDVCVLPSHTEGLPRVMLEAQAAETPVIATRVGGVPEVIADGETGLLCSPHAPAELAAAIETLAGDAGERSRAVETNRTWANLYDRYERALTAVVQRGYRESR